MTNALSCSRDPEVHVKNVKNGLKKISELAAVLSGEEFPEKRAEMATSIQEAVKAISRDVETALMTLKLKEFFRTEIIPGGPDHDFALVRHKVRIRKRDDFPNNEDYREYVRCKLSEDIEGMYALQKKLGWQEQRMW